MGLFAAQYNFQLSKPAMQLGQGYSHSAMCIAQQKSPGTWPGLLI